MGLMIMSTMRFEKLMRERVAREMICQNISYEKDILKKQTDITYLQNQINPHFLYNTLECIRGQALEAGIQDIAETVHALSLFFRYSISVKGDYVTMENEIENVQNYLTIQNYRFRDRFSTEILIDEEEKNTILSCKVPKLILQPIVENAVNHAFSGKLDRHPCITIRICRSEQDIHIIVSDNGTGMSEKSLFALQESIYREKEKETSGIHTGIGLRNVHMRIQLLYGTSYGVSLGSAEGKGTTVELFFPMRKKED